MGELGWIAVCVWRGKERKGKLAWRDASGLKEPTRIDSIMLLGDEEVDEEELRLVFWLRLGVGMDVEVVLAMSSRDEDEENEDDVGCGCSCRPSMLAFPERGKEKEHQRR